MRGSCGVILSCLLVAALLAAALVGCAGSKQTFRVDPNTESAAVVHIQAGDFYFRPGIIQAPPGTLLILQVTNVSGRRHNITIKDPGGTVLASSDMDSGETVSVTLALEKSGEYSFYCDRRLHPTLGMKGTIVVATADSFE